MITILLTAGKSLVGFFIGTTAGRIILGLVAFLIWLHFHDARIEARVRQDIVAEQAKLALNRIDTLEKNNAEFRNGSDRDRCLIFMHDSELPESNCGQP